MISELIVTVIESFIYDATASSVKSFSSKLRQKKFIKELKADVHEFCMNNDCIYINSSAFEFFIRHNKFLEKIIERSITTELGSSSKEFLNEEIARANEIAKTECVGFSVNEEQIIKSLYKLVSEKVEYYYSNKLSQEERHMVSACMKEIAELKSAIEKGKEQNNANKEEIIKAIKEENRLNDTKAEIIADLLSKMLCEGRFAEFDDLAKIAREKSDDLAIYYECMTSIFCSDDSTIVIKRFSDIGNANIRDNAIRTAIPVLIARSESMESLLGISTTGLLNEIVNRLAEGDKTLIFKDDVLFNDGLETHKFALNEKSVCEEELLVRQVAIIYLHEKRIKNIHNAMQQVENGHQTWLTKLFIADKIADSFIFENNSENKSLEIVKFIEQVKKDKCVYDCVCTRLRNLYYSVIVKSYLILNRVEDAEKAIPDDLRIDQPLSDFKYLFRILKQDVSLEELYKYASNTSSFWLLNHYFARRNKEELIEFCKEHEDIFEKDWILFFMYLEALKELGLQEEREKQLRNHSHELGNKYEYWNELLDIDSSKETQSEFIEACQGGNMSCLLHNSMYLIVERLLDFQCFELAGIYVDNLVKMGANDYKIFKYQGIIQQNKKNDVEALSLFKTSFEAYPNDVFVIDSIITLSLLNKRKVSMDVIEVAKKMDTARLNMLVAAYYLNEGNFAVAKCANIRSILMTKEEYNPAFGQFIGISTSSRNGEIATITAIGADTAARCRRSDGSERWLCVYKDNVLPYSPYVWNNDYHVYHDEAAGLGYLRKCIGNQITIDNEPYEVMEILHIDCYFFRICAKKMAQNGFAKEISIPSKDGKIDIDAFNEWIVQNTSDERNTLNWLEQYNNLEDVPLPLYTYKRFTRLTYWQFVDWILNTPEIFVREITPPLVQAKGYVLSFSALVILFNIGFPVERIVEMGGVITSSTFLQVESDVAETIKEYDRDTVASLGVLDGKVFSNLVDDEGKEYWLKRAGSFKNYCKSIPVVYSEKDIGDSFFGKIDSKEILGICDYDAISYVQHNKGYSLVSIEAFLCSLSINEEVKMNVISVPNWLVIQEVSAEDIVLYIKKLMSKGCLLSITREVIYYISECVSAMDESPKANLYTMWDDLLSSLEQYPEKQKQVFVQAVSEVLASFEENKDIDRGILNVLLQHMLVLRNLRLKFFVNEEGKISYALEKILPTDQESTGNKQG